MSEYRHRQLDERASGHQDKKSNVHMLEKFGYTRIICMIGTGQLFIRALLFPTIEAPLGIIAAAIIVVGLLCALVTAIGYTFFMPLYLSGNERGTVDGDHP